MTSTAGRVYMVTGAASGIGAATATTIAGRGHRVVLADLNGDLVHARAGELQGAYGEGILAVELDVTRRDMWDAAVGKVADTYGRLDGLVNNAGITRDSSLGKMTDSQWQQVLDVHLSGAWLGCQIAAPLIKQSDYGAIVNVSSIGRHGEFGQANYAAAKAGIVGLTKVVAIELSRSGVRCNAVAPGAIETPMLAAVPKEVLERWQEFTLLSRVGRPEEVAAAIWFLLSEDSSFITAHVLEVNGGEKHY